MDLGGYKDDAVVDTGVLADDAPEVNEQEPAPVVDKSPKPSPIPASKPVQPTSSGPEGVVYG